MDRLLGIGYHERTTLWATLLLRTVCPIRGRRPRGARLAAWPASSDRQPRGRGGVYPRTSCCWELPELVDLFRWRSTCALQLFVFMPKWRKGASCLFMPKWRKSMISVSGSAGLRLARKRFHSSGMPNRETLHGHRRSISV